MAQAPPALSDGGISLWLQLQVLNAVSLVLGLLAGIPIMLLMAVEACTKKDFWRADYVPPPACIVNGEHGEHIYFEANGIRFHAVTKGEGPLLLCLHGFPECWYSYKVILKAFSASHKVVAVDMRGYGWTDHPNASFWESGGYDMEVLVNDVVAMIPALGYDKASLVCHDWGGVVGWQTVLRHPALFDRVVTLAMPHPRCWVTSMGLPQLSASWYIAFFNLPWLPELFTSRRNHHMTRRGVFTGKVMGVKRPGAASPDDMQVYLHNSSSPHTTTCGINYYRNLFSRDVLYSRIVPVPKTPLPVPVLSVIPDCDGAILRSTYDGQAKVCSDLKELRLTNASHWITLDAPRELTAAMYDFLQVPAQSRMALEQVSSVPAEPCTMVHYRDGAPVPGGITSPVTNEDVAGGAVSSATARAAQARRRSRGGGK